ncbi:DUF6335 family protein [Laspinema olomoucense]|uniref:DUF6335 family protein n=1 Tax=Laspinema olomoucense D3b TaxID=2953688 RepID=A0ABT2NFI3_9CYAN|nr:MULTISPECIES: DUF6335 family protein [unclassified Laspinema]MCT7981256.1 DUF6335 family protein [Laspinema sp. D3b]MCT7991702.1 DUF6335 family protein [Laspinema sp. D3a]MCT7997272.1 DUF6335 family protein [Laspinema sp. D3c]
MTKNKQEKLKKMAQEEGSVEDLSQALTESLGTGLANPPGTNIGGRSMENQMKQYTHTSPELTGGDVDAAWTEAQNVGDEAVGGTVATPDQDIVDEIGAAAGVEQADRQELRVRDELSERDEERWELDPESSEEYEARRESLERDRLGQF